MQTLNGATLPQLFKLSAHANQRDAIRITGLKPGQIVEIDVTLDGGYKQPDLPVKAEWIGDKGREGVHTALLSISDSDGFILNFTNGGVEGAPGAELKDSRGRGLNIFNSKGFTVNNAYIRGARTAGIALDECSGYTFNYAVTVGSGNYQDKKGEGPNYPGSIKMTNCSNYTMNDCYSIQHTGNGMTPTMCQGGTWNRPTCIDVFGANIYWNAAANHTVTGGLCFAKPGVLPPAYVLNTEEEVRGVCENAQILNCACFDMDDAFGVWGNEGVKNLVIEKASVLNGMFISKNGWKVGQNATVRKLDQTGTVYRTTVPDAVLSDLRAQGAALEAMVRKHGDLKAVSALRLALMTTIEGLRPVDPPVDPPAGRAMRKWLKEGTAQHAAAAAADVAWLEEGETQRAAAEAADVAWRAEGETQHTAAEATDAAWRAEGAEQQATAAAKDVAWLEKGKGLLG